MGENKGGFKLWQISRSTPIEVGDLLMIVRKECSMLTGIPILRLSREEE